MLGGEKSTVLASLEHDNLPHFVLYFLLAEHVFLEITVSLSWHVINCFFLDILLCSYLLSFLTSWFSLKKKKVRYTLLFTILSLLYLFAGECKSAGVLPPYSNTSPWPSHLAPWHWRALGKRGSANRPLTWGGGRWPDFLLIKKTGPAY